MHYSILIYAAEGAYERLPAETQETILQTHRDLQAELAAKGQFVTARLMPVANAVTLKPTAEIGDRPLVVDGPFAETKERFMGFYVVECDTLEDAIEIAGRLTSPIVSLEVRPVAWAGGILADA